MDMILSIIFSLFCLSAIACMMLVGAMAWEFFTELKEFKRKRRSFDDHVNSTERIE